MSLDFTLQDIQKLIPDTSAIQLIRQLADKGYVQVYENLKDQYKPKLADYIFLQKPFDDEENLKHLIENLEKKPKQLNILLSYLHLQQTNKLVSKKELLDIAQASTTQLKPFIEKNIFAVKAIEQERVQFEQTSATHQNILSTEQQIAYENIVQAFQNHKPVLLQGITGSGKTHIYFKLIQDCLTQQKQVLYLLPEIALTAQIINKLRGVFGNQIGIYHSRFSQMERVELWKNIQSKKYPIVIGARSALLLPFDALGLIIVDEEHDQSYKQQDPAPRYHARDAALFLAHSLQSNIILGSATPSIESLYNAEQKKFQKVILQTRYGSAKLPEVVLVDMKKEQAQKKVKGLFSSQLLQAIEQSIASKKQILLFQNRRGYSPFILCADCAWIPHCKYCDVSLTYHKMTDQMHCHYCNTKTPYISICPACGGNRLKAQSYGTEKVEEEIKKLFPKARVQRFDWDVMRTKNKHQEIIQQFEKRSIDILVGTQMIVKGLDFEHVNLVGVLNADALLAYPDFRVHEKAYQLLEQVSGRAGRKDQQSQVMIQLYKPNHPLITQVLQHDISSFYQLETDARKEFQYPPYSRLIKITIKHRVRETAMNAAAKLAEALKTLPKTSLFGPAEPSIARIKNAYIQEILLKTNKDYQHLQMLKPCILQQVALLTATRNYTSISVQIDVDPL
ncbi:MAG: primosomal protein N' [Chitinophagaceae bacterium]